MNLPFINVRVEQVIPKRREVIASVIGNAIASLPPFQNLPKIIDRSGERIQFETLGVIPGRWFRSTGSLQLEEEGIRTRVTARMNLTGLLLLTYAWHWLGALVLWLIQGLWATLIDPELVGPVQDWVVVALLVWPGLLFLVLRRRARLRLKTYVNNLVFFA